MDPYLTGGPRASTIYTMSDIKVGARQNAGKARMDLIPWPDIVVTDDELDMELVYEFLKVWFYGAPTPLEVRIPRRQLLGIASVLGRVVDLGKYAPRNWEIGQQASTCFNSASRHAEAAARGELLDPETGFPHEYHFWTNVMFAVVMAKRGRADMDDRPPAHPAIRAQLDRAESLIAQLTGTMSPGPNPAKPNGIN
jgi:hypothetical protein